MPTLLVIKSQWFDQCRVNREMSGETTGQPRSAKRISIIITTDTLVRLARRLRLQFGHHDLENLGSIFTAENSNQPV